VHLLNALSLSFLSLPLKAKSKMVVKKILARVQVIESQAREELSRRPASLHTFCVRENKIVIVFPDFGSACYNSRYLLFPVSTGSTYVDPTKCRSELFRKKYCIVAAVRSKMVVPVLNTNRFFFLLLVPT
jgi:hypothetical protein